PNQVSRPVNALLGGTAFEAVAIRFGRIEIRPTEWTRVPSVAASGRSQVANHVPSVRIAEFLAQPARLPIGRAPHQLGFRRRCRRILLIPYEHDEAVILSDSHGESSTAAGAQDELHRNKSQCASH